MWFPNRSDTNRPEQLQKQAKSLKLWSYVEEELYYPSSENKGTDQLHSYREADLRLCFRLCRLLVFPWGGSFIRTSIVAAFYSQLFVIFIRTSKEVDEVMSVPIYYTATCTWVLFKHALGYFSTIHIIN